MVKYFDSTFIYDYSFPAVTLAYFLRYPNPFSAHVLSTDILSTSLENGRLTTTRLHHKRSRLPPAIIKLLPSSVLGNVFAGQSSSYILETSTINIEEGWMQTESRNLDWTAILSVVERQRYERDSGRLGQEELSTAAQDVKGHTHVSTTVKFRSRLGDRIRTKWKVSEDKESEDRKGFFTSLGTAGIQRSIEAIASRRGVQSQTNSKHGMTLVLERLRTGGLIGVLDGMRQDKETILGTEGTTKTA